MISWKNVLTLVQIALGYGLLCVYLPSLCLHDFVEGKSLSYRFIFYQVCANIYLILWGFALAFLKHFNVLTLWLTLVILPLTVTALRRRKTVAERFLTVREIGKTILMGMYGMRALWHDIILSLRRRCVRIYRRYIKGHVLELLGLCILCALILFLYGQYHLTHDGFAYGDENVHFYREQELLHGNGFPDGLYPHGMHFLVSALSGMFGLTLSRVSLTFGCFYVCLLFCTLYLILKETFSSKTAVLFGIVFFLATDIFVFAVYWRYQAVLPMELGLIPYCIMIYALPHYMRSRDRRDFLLFVLSVGWCIHAHFYTALAAALTCVAFGIVSLIPMLKKKVFLRLIAGGLLGILLGVVPFGVGYALGYPFQDSMNWVMSIIESDANTIYSDGGLSAFGLDEDDFVDTSESMDSWLNSLITTWSDGLIESDEIIKYYVDSFRNVYEDMRKKMGNLRNSAKTAGNDTLATQLEIDMGRLNEMDSELEQLLKKRKNKYLIEEDKIKLQSLIDEKDELELKYNLKSCDGYEKVLQSIRTEIVKARARGDTSVEASVYEKGVTAMAEGYAAVMNEIETQYDANYALIQLMEHVDEQEAETEKLNQWYAENRKTATEEYVTALHHVIDPVWEGKGVQNASRGMVELMELFREYSTMSADGYNDPEILTHMNKLIDDMNEDDLFNFHALLQRIQGLIDGGMEQFLDSAFWTVERPVARALLLVLDMAMLLWGLLGVVFSKKNRYRYLMLLFWGVNWLFSLGASTGVIGLIEEECYAVFFGFLSVPLFVLPAQLLYDTVVLIHIRPRYAEMGLTAASLIFFFFMAKDGHVKEDFTVETNIIAEGDIKSCYRIMEEYPDQSWTVVSTTYDLNILRNHGYHYEIIDLLKLIDAGRGSLHFPLDDDKLYMPAHGKDIFIVVETKIDQYNDDRIRRNSHIGADILKNRGDPTPELALTALPEADLLNDSKIYAYPWRAVVMSKLYYWMEKVKEAYPNEVSVYYQDETVTVYHIHQDEYFPLDLMLDYQVDLR